LRPWSSDKAVRATHTSPRRSPPSSLLCPPRSLAQSFESASPLLPPSLHSVLPPTPRTLFHPTLHPSRHARRAPPSLHAFLPLLDPPWPSRAPRKPKRSRTRSEWMGGSWNLVERYWSGADWSCTSSHLPHYRLRVELLKEGPLEPLSFQLLERLVGRR
jgi:hypothetical protein